MAGFAQTGYAKQFGWRPPKPRKYRNSGGGVAYNPNVHVPPAADPTAAGGLTAPPPGTYDPALEAQREAALRGEHDTLGDIASEKHFAKTDLNQALRDIKTSVSRKRLKLGTEYQRDTQKLGTDFERGNEKLSNREADTKQQAARSAQDYATKLSEIGRQFGELGHRQAEGANASGVNDSGTSAAAAAARARNQQIAEAPIHTAQGRLGEDLATALSRISTSRGQLAQDRGTALSHLEQDRGTSLSQLKQDRERERLLSHRDFGRQSFELGRKAERTRREAAITNAQLLEEEVYRARQEHPAAFGDAAQQALAPNKKKGRKR